MSGDNGSERLTRMQQEIDELRADVRILLRAQILQKDQIDHHETRLDRIEAALDRMAANGERLDERIEKLVSAIGELVRQSNPGLSSLSPE
jgi:septal ring factor EnvC (AmiA/AmiB activator)